MASAARRGEGRAEEGTAAVGADRLQVGEHVGAVGQHDEFLTYDDVVATVGPETAADARTRRLVLLPIEIERADSSQRYLATGLRIGIVRRLDRLGGHAIRYGARAEWPVSPAHDTSATGRVGATAMLRVVLNPAGDSLDVRVSVADSASRTVRDALARRFAANELAEIESAIAAAIAGR